MQDLTGTEYTVDSYTAYIQATLSSNSFTHSVANETGATVDKSSISVSVVIQTRNPIPSPTPAPTTQTNGNHHKDKDKGLSGGAIAGAVIGSLLGFALLVFGVAYYFTYIQNKVKTCIFGKAFDDGWDDKKNPLITGSESTVV